MNNENSMSKQLESVLNEVLEADNLEDKQVSLIDDNTIQIKEQTYQIVRNYRNGYNHEAFTQRYEDFFEKYDFIVGDWGHEQLRLRGFYQLGKRKVPRDQQIDFVDDYIKEYCNFGCAYFVIGKAGSIEKYKKLAVRYQSKSPHENKGSQSNTMDNKTDGFQPKTKQRNPRKGKSHTFKKKRVSNTKSVNTPLKTTERKTQGNRFVIKQFKKD